MAKGAGPAIHIHPVGRDAVFMHEGHGDHREGLVHLPQIDIANLPAKPVKKLGGGRHRGCGEPLRCVRMAGMCQDPRARP